MLEVCLEIPVSIAIATCRARGRPGDTGHAGDALTNPFTGDSDVEAGGRLYRSHCAVCHGIEGEGGRGAALTTGMFRHGGTDRDLYTTISEGIPGTEMPGIFFNGKQLWQIVSYVRSLSEGRGADMTQGDPDKGQAVYAANGLQRMPQDPG